MPGASGNGSRSVPADRHRRHHRAQRVGAFGGRRQQDDASGQPGAHDHGGGRAQARPHQVHVVEGVAHPHRPRLLLLGQHTAHDRAGEAVRHRLVADGRRHHRRLVTQQLPEIVEFVERAPAGRAVIQVLC